MVRGGRFVLFLALSLCVYLVAMTFSETIGDGVENAARLAMAAAFLLVALFMRRRNAEGASWRVFYALFAAAAALYVSWRFSGVGNRVLSIPLNSAPGLAIAKLSSAVLTVAAIVLLVRAVGKPAASLYLRLGNLKLGLAVGLIGFAVLSGLALVQALGSGMNWQNLRALAPWVLVFILANGFLEEILFRGLFLGRLEPLIGRWPAYGHDARRHSRTRSGTTSTRRIT